MSKSRKVKLSHVRALNFKTVGVGQWLDDEIINYFVSKWCSKSQTTLGLGTFFACKFIFQENLCIRAKTGVKTLEDEKRVQRWCRAAEVRLFSGSQVMFTDSRIEGSGSGKMGPHLYPN